VRGSRGSLNGASVHLHLGAEGRLSMAYSAVAPIEVVASSRRAGGRRKSHGPHGPNRLHGSWVG
jgi:hypothetical protein